MEGAGRAMGRQPGRSGGGPVDHLGVGQSEITGYEADPVVVRSLQYRQGDCFILCHCIPKPCDLGRNPHYWNTLHFSPSRVTFAGALAEWTAAP
jgi:hypothetical protein